MPLGNEVDVGPGDVVLDGDPALPKGHSPPILGDGAGNTVEENSSIFSLIRMC